MSASMTGNPRVDRRILSSCVLPRKGQFHVLRSFVCVFGSVMRERTACMMFFAGIRKRGGFLRKTAKPTTYLNHTNEKENSK